MEADAQQTPPSENAESQCSDGESRMDASGLPPTQSPQNWVSPPKPPSLRFPVDGSLSNTMTQSSAPLGQINAARRPAPPPVRASGLTSDIAAKMKAFSLSRQGAPSQRVRSPPGPVHSLSTNNAVPSGAFAPGSIAQSPVQPDGGSFPSAAPQAAGGMSLPAVIARPQVPNWASSPQINAPNPRLTAPRPGMGGLAAKRGLKGGGMKLSDATGPPQSPATDGGPGRPQPPANTGSAFSKYSNIIDTQKGSLNFKNKAVIHGGGIDFTSGTSFSISLDEVDTMEELGRGNYGTVYKVRHSRAKMRRPGQGLRGAMSSRPSNASISSVDSDDSTASAPITTTTTTSTGTGIVMAMKEIRLELDDAKFAAIIMELDVLHRCISPFIVSFYGAFFQEGSVYICLEFMDGGSVDKLYGDGVPEGVLKKITLSTVMGLKCLKDEHNIIHRDVKPTNILVNTRGQVKICDFGVSGNLVASIAKTNIGCQSYMAPERISGGGVAQAGANPGGGTYSVQSDVWSLGLTIIECAMGRYPYPPETYNNIFSQLSAIVDGDPPDLPTEGYSDAGRDFVRSCLHKIPKMRPTYSVLLRHRWLSPLLKIPAIAEDEEAEAAAEADEADGSLSSSSPTAEGAHWHSETADKEVAAWVRSAIERKMSGKMSRSQQPALHAVSLDKVSRSPLLDHDGLTVHTAGMTRQDASGGGGDEGEEWRAKTAVASPADPEPRDGVTVENAELRQHKVDPMDFAVGAVKRCGEGHSDKEGEREGDTTEVQAPGVMIDGSLDVSEKEGQ